MRNLIQRSRFSPERSLQWLLAGCSSLALNAHGQNLNSEDFDCLIEPNVSVMVGTPIQGVIDAIEVERSEFVEAGQIIATLKSGVEIAAMEQARFKAAMRSEIQARQADLELAEVNMRRTEELIEKQMVPLQERDEAVAQLEVAKMALTQARDNQRLHDHEYARARELVEQRVIRSPIAGVVTELRAFPGEFVYENPIVTIAQLNPLRVEAILPARFFGQIDEGMLATIEPEIASDTPLESAISSIDRLIDTASGTFLVRLEIANPEYRIPGGQRCTVKFYSAN